MQKKSMAPVLQGTLLSQLKWAELEFPNKLKYQVCKTIGYLNKSLQTLYISPQNDYFFHILIHESNMNPNI
jgi:hypothetical protein